jgi:hypothetical protein
VVSVVNGFVRCLNTVSIQANASLFVIIFDAACAFAHLSHHKVTPAAWISAAKARAAVMLSTAQGLFARTRGPACMR